MGSAATRAAKSWACAKLNSAQAKKSMVVANFMMKVRTLPKNEKICSVRDEDRRNVGEQLQKSDTTVKASDDEADKKLNTFQRR